MKINSPLERFMRATIGLYAIYEGMTHIHKFFLLNIALYILGIVWFLTGLTGYFPIGRDEEE